MKNILIHCAMKKEGIQIAKTLNLINDKKSDVDLQIKNIKENDNYIILNQIRKLKRKRNKNNYINYWNRKTKKQQLVLLNIYAKMINQI